MLEEVVSLYQAYLDEFRRLEQNRKPLEGAFGLGGGPKNDPCHEKFIQDLERLLENLTAQAPTPEQAGQVLEYIFCTAPARWESKPAVYWTLLAAQGSAMGLIEQLDSAAAKALYDAYKSFYPRHQRFPVQNKVLAALQEQYKAK